MQGDRYTEPMEIDELRARAWPGNPKTHDIPKIRASIRRWGFNDPPTLDERTGKLVEGHGRVEALIAMRDAGEEPPVGVEVEGSAWRILVNRGVRFESDDEAEAYLLAHNELGAAGGYDLPQLGDMMKRIQAAKKIPIASLGFTQKTIARVLRDKSRKRGEPSDVDTKAEPVAKLGDLWSCGVHRVICGDSNATAVLDLLLSPDGGIVHMVATDPPFAIYGSSTGIGADIADDKMVRPFFDAMWRVIHSRLRTFGHAYVCCDWRSFPPIRYAAAATGMSIKNKIIWNKANGLGSSYANIYEEIAFAAKLPEPKAMRNAGEKGQRVILRPNLLTIPRVPQPEKVHNAEKPIELLEELITNSSDEGQVVLDLYAGSGSTMIAAHRLGRVARLVELEPARVDLILAKWRAESGEEPKLLHRDA